MTTKSPFKAFLQVQAHGDSGSRARVPALALTLTAALAMLGGGSMLASAQSDTSTATADSCPAGTPATGSQTANLCLTIDEEDIYFKPNLVTIPADTAVQFIVTNDGAVRHNFAITDHGNSGLKNLNISFDTDPGKTGATTINAPAGDYYFYCNEPGHEAAGMRGYLTVTKDAKITTSEATVTPRAG